MPTFKVLIFKHQKKEDGTFNVKIRVTHNRESKYIPTSFYIKDKQITGTYEIKDKSILKKVEEEIDIYWEAIKHLPDVSGLNVTELIEAMEREKEKMQKVKIDFIAFSNQHIKDLKANGGKKYAASFRTTVNSLCDFFGHEKVYITEITTKTLIAYESYLRSDRTIVRHNQFNRLVSTTQEGMGNGALTYLTNIRTLFNAAVFKYNDEDAGITVITHYPFRKYKFEKKKLPQKRSLKPAVIKQIIGFTEEKSTRATLGRDVFLISFYLLGTNLIDLFEARRLEHGRIIYNRSKTEDRRADSAFISIKVERELELFLDKYRDKTGKGVFCFYKMYSSSENFIKAVNIGLGKVAKSLELGHSLTTYYARHSWATIARNDCGVPKEDISMALNHSDPNHKVTDAYLETDWGIIDRANRQVLDTLKEKKKDDHEILMEDPDTLEEILQAVREDTF
jgi:integrase